MIARLFEFARDDSGSALVEYALIISLVSIVSYAALMLVGDSLEGFFSQSSSGLGSVVLDGQ